MKLFFKVFLVMILTQSTTSFSQTENCNLTSSQIRSFFNDINHWTEVAPNTTHIDATNPAELILNTADFRNTEIRRNGRRLRSRFTQACLSNNGNTLSLKGQVRAIGFWWSGDFEFRNTGHNDFIEGDMNIRLGSFPFDFRPNHMVER